MGQTNLTDHQRQILELVAQDKYLTANFFFTGGTALSGTSEGCQGFGGQGDLS